VGQKVNPYGLRLGIINDWRTRWYNEKEFAAYLSEDIKIRRHMIDKLSHAGLARIDIERTEQQVKIVIYAGRPGIVIGKKGAEVDKLRNHLEKLTSKRVRIDIQEVRRPEISAPLIAQNIAQQLEGRVSFRRAMKKAVSQAMAGGVKGVRISSAGRLGGAEMSRTEWYREGRVPLHTLKADIEYGTAEANTKSGKIGVKVWVYHGDVPLRGLSVRHETEMDISEENARPMPPRPKRVIERKEPDAAVKAPVAKPADVVAPAVKAPAATEPAVEVTEIIVEAAPVEEKAAKPTAKKEAAAKKPAVKKPAKAEAKEAVEATEAKAVKKPTTKKPAVKKPAAKKETAAKPPAKAATAKKAADKPAAKKPAAKKPAPKKEK
jgi:small subunit ribosomal protein S3